MLKIRMQRIGRINMPSYRLIVVEHTESPKTGRFTDIVGTYNPRSKVRTLDEAKIKDWLSKGAQPSATVHNMLVSEGIVKGKKINVLPAYKEPEKPADLPAQAGEPVAEVPAGAPAEGAEAPAEAAPAEEAPAEEKPAEEKLAEEVPAAEETSAPAEEKKAG